MSVPEIIGLALGLAMDAFAVAISTGFILPEISPRHYFRLSFHFGLFQALMPIVGWLAGRTVAEVIVQWNHWIAFALLAYVGGRMIYESFTNREEKNPSDPTRGVRLVVLSVATSLDALAIGLSLAILGVDIILPAIYIGIITMVLTFLGMRLGRRLGRLFGSWVEKIGGVILIGIGIKILIDHLV
ncbi:MAG: manganese efflux pump MntP family protein [Calditrichia bacterium]